MRQNLSGTLLLVLCASVSTAFNVPCPGTASSYGLSRSTVTVMTESSMMQTLKAALAATDPSDWETREHIWDRIDRQVILEGARMPATEEPADIAQKAEEVLTKGLPLQPRHEHGS